ncbi:TPA: radical SAM protein [Campylobacter lari]|uniref:radical SAM/SPASM domain-containing protein n=1 Tax=Campylobacter TaxID=194 RepID=UPI001059E03C|nr:MULTISPECIES: radical SAM protein [Campylobacter]EAI4440968.1 radical SAM protein [Campylobacter lari]EDP6879732.1 radical SAM protein [Campylobacter lari]MCV3408843.1 radical SAM protein [Campylobacter sp. IFREMER_LSEM_CL1890]TDJ91171.1 radical SAM protein [Campylobacter lari]HEC1796702.1 radical SAM protein [Campylobacter lari]
MDYELFKHVSTLHEGNTIYFYNWMNNIGLSIEKENILKIDSNIVNFSKHFEQTNIDYLIKNMFISKNIILDGLELQKEEFKKQLQRENDSLHLILLPAGYACNFRCVYCYENHQNTSKFSTFHNDKILQLINKHLDKNIHIEYFGGEPLLNYKWIKIFQEKIKNIQHNASMTTNGYLLSSNKFQDLLQRNITNYQITIDGIQETHDKLRIKCNGSGSYKTIMKNLQDISKLNSNYSIILRCNFNQESSKKLNRKLFFENLNFLKHDYRFRLIFRPIGLYSDANGTTTNKTFNAYYKDKYNVQNLWEQEALERGFLLGDISLYSQIGGSICYASKKNTMTITPDMNILKCTIAVDQTYNNFGKIKDNIVLNANKIQQWEKYINFDSNCGECFFFFQCMGRSCALKNFIKKDKACPIQPTDRDQIIDKIRKQKLILKERLIDNEKKNYFKQDNIKY